MKHLLVLVLSTSLSACAIGEKLEAVENIQLSDCINECSDSAFTEGDGGSSACLEPITESGCFDDLEGCFDVVHECNDYCILCKEDGSCDGPEGECYRNCNDMFNSCTDGIDLCVEQLVDATQDSLVNDCLKPFAGCVAVCIEEVEDSLK